MSHKTFSKSTPPVCPSQNQEIKIKIQTQVGQREPPISVHSKPGCTMCPGSPVAFRTVRSCPLPTGRGVLYVDTEQVGFLRLRSLPPHKQNNSNQIENFYNDAVQIENTEKRNIDKQVQSSCSSCRQRRTSCSSCYTSPLPSSRTSSGKGR